MYTFYNVLYLLFSYYSILAEVSGVARGKKFEPWKKKKFAHSVHIHIYIHEQRALKNTLHFLKENINCMIDIKWRHYLREIFKEDIFLKEILNEKIV